MTHEDQHQPHVMPLWVYLSVAGALLILTVVTVAASYVDFSGMSGIPSLNLIVAMLIATVKAGLVGLIFMHLLFDDKFYSFIFSTGLVVLGIFIILTLIDTERRGEIDPTVKSPIQSQVDYQKKAP